MERRIGTWTTLLQVFAILPKVWDKKGNLKIAEPPKIFGKVETGTTNTERRKKRKKKENRSRSRSNNHHNSKKSSANKPNKNDRKEWPTLAEASKVESRKKRPFFGKIRPYKQRQEERFETVEIENYDESQTHNNDQQNEHTIIVQDTQDVRKNIFACLFSIHNTISLSRHEQVCWEHHARCSEPNGRKWEQLRKK